MRLLAAVALLLALAAPAQAAVYTTPPPLVQYEPGDQGLIDAWGLTTVPVGSLSLNRVATPIASSHTLFTGTDAKALFVEGFRWNSDDWTTTWSPQGISGSGDADPSGQVDGSRWLAVSWHYSDQRARVTFVNLDALAATPTSPSYRHVLLVEPYTGPYGPSYRHIPIHAGGLVWFRHLLYVVDTFGGLRVFDTAQISVPTGTSPDLVGRTSGGLYNAAGYGYVMPQVARYTPVAPFAMPWSFIGLDQSPGHPPQLVVGEYDDLASSLQPVRLYAFDLDPVTGLLVADPGGQSLASASLLSSSRGLQGVHSARDPAGQRTLYTTSTVTDDLFVSDVDGGESTLNWPNNPQGLTYDPASDELWTLTEDPSKRIVFAVPRGSL